jgi:hypothetical protein
MKYGSGELLEGLKRRASFIAWQPSTWPEANADVELFSKDLQIIFEDSLLDEINNVISDAEKVNGDIQHRGHVIALALFCAVDTLSSYAFSVGGTEVCPTCGKGKEKIGPRYQEYIERFFPDDYKPFAEGLYKAYRNSLVHSWNLFEVAITPDNDPIQRYGNGESILVGLLNFRDALEFSIENFIAGVRSDPELNKQAYLRYNALRAQAIK